MSAEFLFLQGLCVPVSDSMKWADLKPQAWFNAQFKEVKWSRNPIKRSTLGLIYLLYNLGFGSVHEGNYAGFAVKYCILKSEIIMLESCSFKDITTSGTILHRIFNILPVLWFHSSPCRRTSYFAPTCVAPLYSLRNTTSWLLPGMYSTILIQTEYIPLSVKHRWSDTWQMSVVSSEILILASMEITNCVAANDDVHAVVESGHPCLVWSNWTGQWRVDRKVIYTTPYLEQEAE